MKDGKKVYLQTSGLILSADRSPAGRETNAAIGELLSKHQVKERAFHLGNAGLTSPDVGQ